MFTTTTKFKPTARADHTIFGFFHKIGIALAAFNFPSGILAYLLRGDIVIKCVRYYSECATPSTDADGRFERFYCVGPCTDKRIHAALAVVQEVNSTWNFVFVFGSFLEELHLKNPFAALISLL
jgi:hypothetical protein